MTVAPDVGCVSALGVGGQPAPSRSLPLAELAGLGPRALGAPRLPAEPWQGLGSLAMEPINLGNFDANPQDIPAACHRLRQEPDLLSLTTQARPSHLHQVAALAACGL